MLTIARRFLPLALCVFFCVQSGNALGEQTWTEVRSPHFRVITDASGRDGRRIANQFEQMRHVLSERLNGRLDGSAPLTIFAVSDENVFGKLDPRTAKASGGRVAGEFVNGWEKEFAVVRLDQSDEFGQAVVFHEYTHSVLHANILWLPTWLDEGMAEFYGYTRIQTDKILVGAPSVRIQTLRTHPLVPIETMLSDRKSEYSKDDTKVQMFYAESWAMVHFMIFGPGMENGAKLNRFVSLMKDQKSQQESFHEVFGDFKSFDSSLSQYLQRLALSAGVMPPDRGVDPKSFQERKLSPAETDYELACFHIKNRDRVGGRELLEKSMALDPKLAGAHEELGFLDFETGKGAVAESEWKQALALDPAMYRSLFAETMSGPSFSSQTPDQLKATQVTLRHITDLAPNFAPAYVELALIEWKLGTMQQAYKDAREAEKLAPNRAGYHLLTGHILLHGKQPAIASQYARYVAEHWNGPDHNEAVDLWLAVPASSRGEGAPLEPHFPFGSVTARGKLVDVTCASDPKAGKTTISLLPDGASATNPLQLTATTAFSLGFSDTLWWGEDHFSPCNNLAGHTAVVAYKPQGTQGGEIVDLEIRDDLPAKM